MPRTLRFLLLALWLSCTSTLVFAQSAEGDAREAQARFDVQEYQVEGVTLLPAEDIERAVYRFLGPGKTIADVEGARKAVEASYRKRGYATVIVDIPEQEVDAGVVRLKVTEAKVTKLRVLGSRYYSQGRILERTASVSEGSTPNFTAFAKDLQTVNRFPGSKVTPVLRPGPEPGTTEMDLQVEDNNPLSAELELNNHYSPNTTRTRASAKVSYANLWQKQHTLSLQYLTAPEKTSESKVWVASYLWPLRNSDKIAAFYGVRSRSSVAALGDFTVIGNGDILGSRLVMPLPDAGKLYHSLTLGLDYKSFKENITQRGEPGIQTPIRYTTASLSYGGSRLSQSHAWQFSAGVNFGLRGAGSDEQAFDNRRFKANGNFAVWKWDVQRAQSLGKKFELLTRVDGQLADQPVVSNEAFSAGGSSSVRGYLESELIGDSGAHATVELRGPRLPVAKPAMKIRPLAFAEGSYLWLKDPLPGQADEFSIYSAGIGLRMEKWHGLEAALDIGWALKKSPYTSEGGVRAQFSAMYQF